MDSIVSNSNVPGPPVDCGAALTPQQRAVLDEITRLDGQVANMYLGAIQVLNQRGNPDRFALAAHGLRELIEKLAERLNAPIAGGPSLKDKVRELEKKWPEDGIPTVYDEKAGSWTSSRQVRGFLDAAGAFFTWFDHVFPNMRERVGRFFAATDPYGRRLPPPIETSHVDRWIEVRGDLLAVAHHGKIPTGSEFQGLFDKVDELLIERLRPKASEQVEELDRIIAEGEGRDS